VVGEHIIDTQGLPPSHTSPNNLSFLEEVEVKLTNPHVSEARKDEGHVFKICLQSHTTHKKGW